jgi:hypothetical protein
MEEPKKTYHRDYYIRYKDDIDKYQKQYRADHQDQIKKRKKAYYEKNRDKILAHHKSKRIEKKEAHISSKLLSIT